MLNENNHDFVASVLVGSRNYGIHLPESDYDRHMFFLPTLAELIAGRENQYLWHEQVDHVTHERTAKDIRKLTNGLKKPNLNSLEVLFSKEFLDLTTDNRLAPLLERREQFACSDTERLYASLRGMMQNFKREAMLARDYKSDINEELYPNKFYKNAARHMFVSDILRRYADSNFGSFEEAFRMDKDTLGALIAIRQRDVQPDVVIETMRRLEEETAALKNFYCENRNVDHKLYVWLDDFLEQLILDNLKSPVT